VDGASIIWTGVKELQTRLQTAAERAMAPLAAALYAEGLDIMAKTLPVTPKDKGYLRASGRVQKPRIEGMAIVVQLGFGASYSIFVHEAPPELNWTAPGTGPKFLERTVLAAIPGLSERMAARVAATYGI
jgi:hypothetical protein